MINSKDGCQHGVGVGTDPIETFKVEEDPLEREEWLPKCVIAT